MNLLNLSKKTLNQKVRTVKNKNPKTQKFHFIAIGGIGMSALAKFLLELGCKVSGSDMTESKYCTRLAEMGAQITIGHSADNVPDDAVVVASTAIKENNPELVRAKELGLDILHRADLLKLISEGFGKDIIPTFIGFAGTHGKTTTSGLCAFLLDKIGCDPSFAVGGIIPSLNTNSKCNKGDFFVAELDESDGTIVKYSPDVLVINNLEEDHPDFYTDGIEQILETFSKVLRRLRHDAKVVINADCNACELLKKDNKHNNYVTFGTNSGDYQAKNIAVRSTSTAFEVWNKGKKLGLIELSVFGMHNVYNALATLVALLESGIKFEKVAPYFKLFTGMGRRFEFVGNIENIKIYDDYAHHPSEIKATLEGARNYRQSGGRVVTIFQPHRYSRFRALWEDFLTSFKNTDLLIVLDVFRAGDNVDIDYNSRTFCNELNSENVVYVEGTINECAEDILPMLKDNDLVITMGAGDITKMGKSLIELHQRNRN